jgi:hypothetical protein
MWGYAEGDTVMVAIVVVLVAAAALIYVALRLGRRGR